MLNIIVNLDAAVLAKNVRVQKQITKSYSKINSLLATKPVIYTQHPVWETPEMLSGEASGT